MPKVKTYIQSGKVTVGRDNLGRIVQMLNDGWWEFRIKEWKDKRSQAQNNLYWVWVSIIGEELGYRKKEMHETLLREFAPVKIVRKLDGTEEEAPVRTSEMKKDQMTEYMETVDQFAAEMNIQLPRPEEEMLADQSEGEAPF